MTSEQPDPTPRTPLDPGIVAFLDQLRAASAGLPPLESLPPAQARRQADAVRATLHATPPPSVALVEERVLPDVQPALRARVYVPHGAPAGVLVYLHGGGWTIFGLDTHDRLMREYARRGNAIVVGLDYALAPEHVFPTAIEQIAAALRILKDPAQFPQLAQLRFCVGGDSAGANLSLATALALRDAGDGDLVAGLMLTYGVFDCDPTRASFAAYDGPDYMLTAAEMDWFWTRYCPDPRQRTLPLAAPLRAELRALPPVSLTIAECDVLADENRELEKRLAAAGIEVDARIYPGTTHSFIEAFATAPIAAKAVGDQCRWLERMFTDGRNRPADDGPAPATPPAADISVRSHS